jgi:two-component system nitrogen regulation sensor histidine kinase NtrY
MVTFSARLRMALLVAAVLPTALVTIIVIIATSQQIKRIEHQQAADACARFITLFDDTIKRVRNSLQYVVDSPDFQMMELRHGAGERQAFRYTLPLLSLDFLEYTDAGGVVFVSAARPALIGQRIAADSSGTHAPRLRYENDLRGSHPSVTITVPTEKGYLTGGIFLDGVFATLASAVTHSDIIFADLRSDRTAELTPAANTAGMPYRSENDLYAVLYSDPNGEYYPLAKFYPFQRQPLLSNFFTAVAAVTGFSLLLVIPAGLYFTWRTRREFNTLTDGAMRVASGDFSSPVVAAGESEFSDLADSFNLMMRQLTDYRERLIMSQKIAAWEAIGRRMAHEVKNPLTPIAIAADDLKHSFDEHRADFDAVLNDCTATIKGEVDRLRKLIDQFSTFAKMPTPTVVTVPADTFIKRITALYAEPIEKKNLTVENALASAPITVDADQICQVVINLIQNSFEAGCGACRLLLSRNNQHLMITIDDDGPGFPARLLHEGITPYFSTKEGGRGLGLVICQRIVFDHSGVMTLENKPEGGARIIISLPQTNG